MTEEYGDYRDLTDEEAKDILEWFIHTEFFDRRDTKEGKAIIRGILALGNQIELLNMIDKGREHPDRKEAIRRK